MANVRIKMTGHGRGEVYIDGQKINGVRKIAISAEVDCANLIAIDVIASGVEIEGEFETTDFDSIARCKANG